MKLKILLPVLVMALLACTNTAFAQGQVEMADVMRGNGKIYTVVAVCLLILVGLFGYVWLIDRKISRIENESKD